MDKRVLDLTGKKFGRLKVIARAPNVPGRAHAYWKCKCDCGKINISVGYSLTAGTAKSCGCLREELLKTRTGNLVHGMSETPIYKCWTAMKQRCLNPGHPEYSNYGARGITICARWRKSFKTFFLDMGERPKGSSLDRIDNRKGYSPNNCRWTTSHIQNRNKRTNRVLTYKGKTLCVEDWAFLLGINVGTIHSRLRYGLSIDKVLSTTKMPSRLIDLNGETYGRLTVIRRIPNPHGGKESFWRCRCKCGRITDVISSSLRRGTTRSCGCLRSEVLRERNKRSA